MPKFREWRSRLSNHGTGFDTQSVRCTDCRKWFQPLSAQEKACANCHSGRTSFSSGEKFSSYEANPGRYGPLSMSSPKETSSSSSAQFFFTPNLRRHNYETQKFSVSKSMRGNSTLIFKTLSSSHELSNLFIVIYVIFFAATPHRNFTSFIKHFKVNPK